MSTVGSLTRFIPLAVVVVVGLLFGKGAEAVTCPSSLSYGDACQSSISAGGEVDSYLFEGTTGERAYARMMETASSSLIAKVEIRRPDGSLLCSNASPNWSRSIAEVNCSLNVSGTHTVRAMDSAGSGTGSYGLYLQRTSGPVSATSVEYGGNATGTLPNGEVADYAFSGTSGERVYARLAEGVGDSFSPKVQIYRPDGTLLCSASSSTAAEANCLLGSTGTHTILAMDTSGTTSTYGLYLQRTSSPVGTTAMSYGDNSSASLAAGEVRDFLFTGTSGDPVYLRMAESASSSLKPKVMVYRPDGTLLCSQAGFDVGAAQLGCTLDASGDHLILAMDDRGSGTGDYTVSLQHRSDPANATSASYGDNVSASITAAELDTYTFSATSGDIVYIRMGEGVWNGLTTQLRVYAPSGASLCQGQASHSIEITCTVGTTGTHTILAMDYYGPGSGAYILYLQKLNGPTGANSIQYGENSAGTHTKAAVEDYTFSGSSGDRIHFRSARNSSLDFDTYVRVYKPDGSLRCSGQGNDNSEVTCLLDATGPHLVLVSDFNNTKTGAFNVYLQRTSDPVNAGHLPWAPPTEGLVEDAQVIDYTFAGEGGKQAYLLMQETASASLRPEIKIFKPDGSLLCEDDGTVYAEVTCSLPSSGTYTVLAEDYVGDGEGPYELGVAVLVSPPPVFDPPNPPSPPWYPVPPDPPDPVNTASGDFIHTHTDLSIPGRGVQIEFTRYYHAGSTTSRALGVGWTHAYDMYLDFEPPEVTVYFPYGHASVFVLSEGVYEPPAGVFDTLVHNGDGTYTLTTPSQIRYDFSAQGKLTSIADRNDNTTTLNYTGSLLTSVSDPGGRSLTFQYDGSNRIWKATDPLPSPDTRTIEFTYDANNDLTQVEDVKGGTTTYTYSNHRMTSLRDSNSNLATQNIFDSSGRVVEQRDPMNNLTCIYYGRAPLYTSAACPGVSPSPTSSQTVVVNPRGYKTTYTFDSFWRIAEIKDHLNHTMTYVFDGNNNPTCVTDQRGKKTAYSYNSSGNVNHIIDAENTDANCELKQNGVDWDFEYTDGNDIDLKTDPLGRQTDYVYDQDGNLTQVIRKDDQGATVSRTCFTRDDNGLMTELIESTTLTDCTGNKTKFDYDDYGNQTEVIDPRFSSRQDPPVSTLTFDPGGRMLTVTNELDETTTHTYDEQNSVLTVEDNLGNTISNTFDAKGNLETVTDANREAVATPESGEDCGDAGTGDGADDDSDTVVDDGCPSTIYTYDDADRLVEVIDALGNSTTYGYDENGNQTSVTNVNRQPVGDPETGSDCGANGTGDGDDDDSDDAIDDGCPSTIHTYDELDRIESETDALGRVTSYEYDAAGNIIERTDARGLVTEYEYDALNRITLVEHWDGETLVDDIDYTYDDVGNRLTMVDDTGTTEYEYDALGRPTSVTFPCDDTVAYAYDDLPGGSAADYPGRRTVLTYPDTKEVEYTYDEAGNLETVTDWLDNTTTYTYDDDGNLTDTDLPNDVDTDYTYDDAGRLESVVNVGPGPTTISSFDYTLDAVGNRTAMEDLEGTHSYEYDPLYRLTEVTYPDQETDAYTYDAVGNRLTKDTDDYTYDAADQLTDLEGVTYDYDDNGNQTARGNDTFEYDHENRMVESVMDSVTSTSLYNGDGLRMSHTVGQTTTDFIWDVAAGLPVVLQDGTNTYLYGLDLISATDGQAAQTYFVYDGLGSVTDLTGDEGDVVDGYTYDVFGAVRSQSGSSDNFWLFTGEQRDSDSSFYFLRARHYDPATGRLLSRDPVPLGNVYAYAYNNPANIIDPNGRFGFSTVIGGLVGGVVGGLSTYSADVAEDWDWSLSAFVPDRSWDEYAVNIGEGAVIGAACGSIGGQPICFGALAAGASAIEDIAAGNQPDFCEAAVAGLSGYAGGKARSLYDDIVKNVPGPNPRHPLKYWQTYWLGPHSLEEYRRGAVGLPFEIGGELISCGQGTDNPPGTTPPDDPNPPKE